MRLSKTHGFLHTAPFKMRPLSRICNISGQKPKVFAYFGFATAIGVLIFVMRLSKTPGFLHTAPFKIRPLSRIRNVSGQKAMVFAYLGVASAIEVLIFAVRLSNTDGFLHTAPFTNETPITDSQYQRSRTYCILHILVSPMR